MERKAGVKKTSRLKNRFKSFSSEEKINVINKTEDEMSNSDSEYDETGISNPTFDTDKVSSISTTNSSESFKKSKINLLNSSNSRKSIRSVGESSFTTVTEGILNKKSTSTVEAEKPYESEPTNERKISKKKFRAKNFPVDSSTTPSSDSVVNIWTKSDEKTQLSSSQGKSSKRRSKSIISEISSHNLTEDTNITKETTSVPSFLSATSSAKSSIKSKGRFGKIREKLLKQIESRSDENTSESIVKSSSRKLEDEESSKIEYETKSSVEESVDDSLKNKRRKKIVEDLSSGEVVYSQVEPKKRQKRVKKKVDLIPENIPEENTEQEVEIITKPKPKPRKKKKREVIKESSEITSTVDEEKLKDDEILGILIHRIDGIKMHYFISHPLVQVHIFDLKTGKYVAKRKNSKSITSYYEGESAPINYIMPVMTQPYEMKGKDIMTPEWQELLILNENLSYFTQEDPNVIILFEILDFISMTQASRKFKKMGKDGGWHRVAWAFLKLVGANNVLNVGKKVRLQLYYPLNKKWSLPCTAKVSKDMFGWWNNNSKKKYPYTLYVTIKGIEVPNVAPALRSMIPTQEEKGRTTVDDLQQVLEGKSSNLSEERSLSRQSEMKTIRWNRLPGQLCKIPMTLVKKIQVGKAASCFVVKFSRSGRFLACGTMEKYATHSILIYEIPSGEYKSKCCSHFGIIYDLEWNSSDTHLLSSSADCTARLWHIDKEKSHNSQILPHPSYVYSAKFHPRASRVIVTACYDHVIRVWDSTKKECDLMQELSQHSKFVNAICFDDEGDTLFSGDGVGVVCLWNIYVTSQPNKPALTREWTLKQIVKSKDLHCKVINDIILHPGGRRLLISTRDSCIRLFDTKDFTLIQKYTGHQNMLDYIHFTITPCGSSVLSGSEDGSIYVWNTNSGIKLHTFPSLPYKKSVSAIHYHPYEHMFACCSYGENEPVLLYGYEHDAQSITYSLHDLSLRPPPIAAPKFPTSGILKSSFSQTANISSSSEISSTASQNDDDIECEKMSNSESSYRKAKPRKLRTRLSEKSSSVLSSITCTSKESTDRSRTVTFQDEVQPIASKWQKVLDKLNDIVESSSKTSILSEESSFRNSTESSQSTQKLSTEFKVVSLYTHTARNESELNLKPGDVISVINKINGNWWEGVLANGSHGIFPANYVYRIEETYNSEKSSTETSNYSKKTHAILSTSGSPIFLSTSEDDETINSH